MPDIAMCANKECTLRMKCFRYRALPNPWRQSYSGFTPTVLHGIGTCDNFWELEHATTALREINELK